MCTENSSAVRRTRVCRSYNIMNIISVSNVRHDKSISNTFHKKFQRRFCTIQFSQISGLVVMSSLSLSHCYCRVVASIVCCRRRSVFVAVIRAANSKGTDSASLLSFFLAFIKWLTRRPRSRGRTKGSGMIFFYVPLVFHARSVISPVNFTKLAPTAISLRSLLPWLPSFPLAFCYPIAPSSPFFYSRFPTYARRFFYRVCQQFIWLIVLPRVGHKNRYTDQSCPSNMFCSFDRTRDETPG